MNYQDTVKLLEQYCLPDDLSTHDPYDIWSCSLGFGAKRFYNRHKYLALPVVGLFSIFDRFNSRHFFYKKREYPIVRAMAAQVLLNLYRITADEKYLVRAKNDLEWLLNHRGESKSGAGWGTLVPRTVSKTAEYPASMSFSTITPYVLEAFWNYSKLLNTEEYQWIFPKFREFFHSDLVPMLETETELAFSYGTVRDRIEFNSNCYILYCRALLGHILNDHSADGQIFKIYNFVKNHQREDGSWFYSYSGKNSFIDCFHSCFNLKNLFKANGILPLEGAREVIDRGWDYLKKALFDSKEFLFRRFSISNKPGIIKFDLYDNAEALNFAYMIGDDVFASQLRDSIEAHFVRNGVVFSRIDLSGTLICPDYLRWAVMPFMLSVSNGLLAKKADNESNG